MPLCGNSIGTDRRFLAAYLPDIEDYLHYRSVDVSTIKELARRWYPDVAGRAPERTAPTARSTTSARAWPSSATTASRCSYRVAIRRPFHVTRPSGQQDG